MSSDRSCPLYVTSRCIVLQEWKGGWKPSFQKKMICGTPEEHREYHHSFFHPDKERLLGNEDALIDQFASKGGNYKIPGVEWKLNLLLYGPPGTGKSKLIRTYVLAGI